ncbi:hypothetical protein BDDG_11844 [Blastomyces dermatitidis ATCC 18188]|uniref:Uncharacterized protein n=1 Tax=Ajellomyces dermatitidis (strain ATCC 18188 / CBS 674.68) TaxID=653446 RepID=A0A0J9ELL3_AJEDA|nr:hypothetical protein BDDG_11844 [Blastomyces dermatitidis ATCC 18188]
MYETRPNGTKCEIHGPAGQSRREKQTKAPLQSTLIGSGSEKCQWILLLHRRPTGLPLSPLDCPCPLYRLGSQQSPSVSYVRIPIHSPTEREHANQFTRDRGHSSIIVLYVLLGERSCRMTALLES